MTMTATRNGNGRSTREQISGRIELRNDNGIRIDGVWFNYSQYADELPEHEKGDRVKLTVSQGKWIDALTPLLNRDDESRPSDRDQHRHELDGTAPPRRTEQPAPNTDREACIIRQSCLKAAAMLLHGRNSSSADLCQLADELAHYCRTGSYDPFAGE